ncbi:MAG: hypothetical protein RIT81_09525 [Deltaproteobacteria bacterium]
MTRIRLGIVVVLASCSTNTHDLEGSGDVCRRNSDCPSNEQCVFPYDGCRVDGVCSTSACDDDATARVFCGCDGNRVFGDEMCSTEPYTRVQTNASPCEGVAGGERDGGPRDGAIHRCTTNADCPATFICEFEANSCGELGTCRDSTTCEGDAGIGTYCDCNGDTFMGATFCIQQPFAMAGPCPGDRDAGI